MRARAARLREFDALDAAQLKRCRLFAEQFLVELEALAKSAVGEAHLEVREIVEDAAAVRDAVVRVGRRV